MQSLEEEISLITHGETKVDKSLKKEVKRVCALLDAEMHTAMNIRIHAKEIVYGITS